MTVMAEAAPAARPGSPWGAGLLGFALGGFFDGILLHQILQWHHLLSAIEEGALRDLRMQVLADGLFHLLMYAVALAGLWLLWRRRPIGSGAGRGVLGWALVGFGVWHAIDAVLSHWLLGIHRIRMNTGQPLLWDLGWLALFGLVPLAAGWRLRNRDGGGRGSRLAPGLLSLAVLAAGPVAALPPPGSNATLLVFRPGVEAGAVLAAVAEADGRVLWTDGSRGVWAVSLADRGAAWSFYRRGALFVGDGVVPAGCLGWVRG